MNHYDTEILYLWENDIYNHTDICEKLILQYIQSEGKLDNYHSFNYFINDQNILQLKENIIIPYQDMDINEYKHLHNRVS